jgi:hypothetical protein
MSKFATLLLIAVLAVSSLVMVETSFAQSTPTSSVPEFTVELVDHSYVVPASTSIDSYTGEEVIHPSYTVENKTIEITIKKQPLAPGLSYDVRTKSHFEENWTKFFYYSENGGSDLPVQSTFGDTVISISQNMYPPGGQVDLQVEAVIATRHQLYQNIPNLSYIAYWSYETSGWSKTQTVAIPALVTLLLPQNGNFSTSDIPLDFAVGNQASQIKYSLDGGDNVIITGNTTLTGLPNGCHNVTVYETDEFGNTGASETVYFTVEVPFPTILVVASIIGVIVAGVGLLVYFTKRKR